LRTSTFGTFTTAFGASIFGMLGLGTVTVTGFGTATVMFGLGTFGLGTVTVGITGLMTGLGISTACTAPESPCRMTATAEDLAINRNKIDTAALSSNKS
jgi:hypothetical protein